MLVSTGHSTTQSFKHGSVTEKQCLMKGTATTVNPQVNKITPNTTRQLQQNWRLLLCEAAGAFRQHDRKSKPQPLPLAAACLDTLTHAYTCRVNRGYHMVLQVHSNALMPMHHMFSSSQSKCAAMQGSWLRSCCAWHPTSRQTLSHLPK